MLKAKKVARHLVFTTLEFLTLHFLQRRRVDLISDIDNQDYGGLANTGTKLQSFPGFCNKIQIIAHF